MGETAAAELVLIERAARERWSREELWAALLCALPTLTEGEVARLVEAARLPAAAYPQEGRA